MDYVFDCCFVLPVLFLSVLLLPLLFLSLVFPRGHFCSPPPMADESHLPCIYGQSTHYTYPPWTSLQLPEYPACSVISCIYSCYFRSLMTDFDCISSLFLFGLWDVLQSASPLPLVHIVIFESVLFALPHFLVLSFCCYFVAFLRTSSSVSISSFGCTLRIVTSFFMDYF